MSMQSRFATHSPMHRNILICFDRNNSIPIQNLFEISYGDICVCIGYRYQKIELNFNIFLHTISSVLVSLLLLLILFGCFCSSKIFFISSKMKVLIFAIFLSISFTPEISGHLSDFVKDIEFRQIPGSIEYNFEWVNQFSNKFESCVDKIQNDRLICFSLIVDENNIKQGTTQTVLGFLYFIRDANNTLYWTVFTDEERKVNPVTKPVRLGEYSFDFFLC